MCVCLSVRLSVCPCLSNYLSVYLYLSSSLYVSINLSVYLSLSVNELDTQIQVFETLGALKDLVLYSLRWSHSIITKVSDGGLFLLANMWPSTLATLVPKLSGWGLKASKRWSS